MCTCVHVYIYPFGSAELHSQVEVGGMIINVLLGFVDPRLPESDGGSLKFLGVQTSTEICNFIFNDLATSLPFQ